MAVRTRCPTPRLLGVALALIRPSVRPPESCCCKLPPCLGRGVTNLDTKQRVAAGSDPRPRRPPEPASPWEPASERHLREAGQRVVGGEPDGGILP